MSKALHKILNVMTKLSYEKHLHGKGIGRHRHELLTIFIAFQNRLAGWVKGNGRGPDQNSNIRFDPPSLIHNSKFIKLHSTF